MPSARPAASPPDPAPTSERTDAGLGEVFQSVSRSLRKHWVEALEPHGLAPHQARALMGIVRDGPLRAGHLATTLHIAPRSATDVIDALDARGLIVREADPSDRRAIVVTATDAGRAVAGELARTREKAFKRRFERLSATDRAHLQRILTALLKDEE